jgi:hypothetical protein
LEDFIVVDADDVLMILSKKDEQDLKHFVTKIEQ